MSTDNIAVVLETLPLFEASDFDGMARLSHPDILVTGPEGWPERGLFEGRDAVPSSSSRRLTADWGEHRMSDVRRGCGP